MMLSRTPRSSVRAPDQDKENVTIYTPKSVGRSRAIKAGECGPMTPSRQPLAPVNGGGSGMRRVSLKPGLPRIQALRGETNTSQLDQTCTPTRHQALPRSRRHKSRSISTPGLTKESRSKARVDVAECITSHLFDQLLQDGLGMCSSSLTVHNLKNKKTDMVEETTDAADGSSVLSADPAAHPEDREESVSSQQIAAYVAHIINSAKEKLTLEARIDSLEAQLQQPLATETPAPVPSRHPTEEDIAAYVDAVLSVQLQIVQSEYQEKLDSCLGESHGVQESESLASPKDGLPEDTSSPPPSNMSPSDRNRIALPDTHTSESLGVSPLFVKPSQNVATPTSLLLNALDDMEGTPWGLSPGYMLLPPRRDQMRREHLSSEDSYEDEFLRFVHNQYQARSPEKRARTTLLVETAVGTPLKMIDSSSNTHPVLLDDAETSTSPSKVVHIETSMTPHKFADMACGTSTEISSTEECSTQMEYVEMQDAQVGSPIKMASVSVEMTPVKPSYAETNTSPIKMIDESTEVIVELRDSSTDAPHLVVCDAMVGTPIKQTSAGVGTSPISVQDHASYMTPVKTQSTGEGTSPARVCQRGTEMPHVDLMDSGVGTSPPPVMKESAVGTTPTVKVNKEIGTPMQTCSLGIGTTPHHYKDNTTAMTPVLLSSAQTLTSPPVVPSLRFSSSPSSLDSSKLVSHVETAAISNQLLRAELSLLRSQKEQAEAGLQDARRQLQEKEEVVRAKEEKMGALERTARASAEKEVEDLMGQVGEQMMQIGQLEAALREKSEVVSGLENKHQKLKRDFDQQIADLQDDLCRAYRQHQQQITSLQEQYRREDYEGHYTRSQARVRELETQLGAFTQLQEAISRAVNVQNDFALAQKTFSDVEAVFQMTVKQQQELASKKEELARERQEVEAEKASLEQMQEEREKAKEREVAHFLEVQNLEAAMIAEAEQHASKEAEFEKTKQSLQETINQLQKQCQGLSSGKLAVEVDLRSTQTRLFSIEAELVDTKRARDDQIARVSGLEKELDSCRTAGRQLQVLEAKFKAMERQFLENKQFLEEERLALEESSKEVETELRITSLELARSKAAQEEGDVARRQLQETLTSLSDQLESMQSELDHTKAQAHWMLLSQGSELTNASAALDTLSQQVATALAGMKEARPDQASQQQSAEEPSPSPPASLVVSVLRAVEHKETPGKETNTAEDQIGMNGEQLDPSEGEEAGERRLTIGQSEASAFQVVKSASSQGRHGDEMKPGGEEEGSRPAESLSDQVKGLKAMFGRMYSITVEREQSLREDIRRLQKELSDKECALRRVVEGSQRDISCLQGQLQDALSHRHQLSHDLAQAQARSHDQRQALDYAQQRMENMATNLARFSDQKTTIEDLERCVSQLTSSLELITREKEEALGQVSALASHPTPGTARQDGEAMGRALRENLLLKKELDKVRMKLLKQQEDHELFYTRAGKQMKVLESNWKKAEAEIQRLDQLFDHCKKVMSKVPGSVCQVDPHLRSIYQMFSTD